MNLISVFKKLALLICFVSFFNTALLATHNEDEYEKSYGYLYSLSALSFSLVPQAVAYYDSGQSETFWGMKWGAYGAFPPVKLGRDFELWNIFRADYTLLPTAPDFVFAAYQPTFEYDRWFVGFPLGYYNRWNEKDQGGLFGLEFGWTFFSVTYEANYNFGDKDITGHSFYAGLRLFNINAVRFLFTEKLFK